MLKLSYLNANYVWSAIEKCTWDFQKAFDTVPHQRITYRGMENSTSNWIEQWLTDRRQSVEVVGKVSNWNSVLGSSSVYKLQQAKYRNLLMTTRFVCQIKVHGDKQQLQDGSDKLVDCSENWRMLFSVGKCKCFNTGCGNSGGTCTN